MNSAIHDRIVRFLEDYAPSSSVPFIKVDYDAWAQHVYDELKSVKCSEKREDLWFELRCILNNIVFIMTSDLVDGTSQYQMIQDDVGESEAFGELNEIYDLL